MSQNTPKQEADIDRLIREIESDTLRYSAGGHLFGASIRLAMRRAYEAGRVVEGNKYRKHWEINV